MTQQDDITQRLNEIHADAGYLFGRVAADGACAGAMAESVRARIDAIKALLSKLRAPVADESPMAKMADALREKARQEQQTYQDRRAQATEWGPLPEGTEADLLTRNAPVAHVAGDETSRYLDWAKDRSAWEMPVGTPVYYSALASAPVAGEAVSVDVYVYRQDNRYLATALLPIDTPLRPGLNTLYAAPQASEAVRDADHPVFAFLLGEGPLRGAHFGDRHPDERGAYWWRKDLMAALSAQPSGNPGELAAQTGAQKGGSDA
ncbi:hypothetical protein LMG3482_01871 [Achromobacter deleyi]|uniref:hypothetical protein n=1 Tax=Achromobacter deleyi TaxID=1353891 RepID=UPI001465B92B|nr:hypothetical protein [Achromobacter deleyi]CAB3845986.1 hypothetical protein LMG3481_01508 [Achromobacter deleyi]CAB3853048.1 hypothetical protein LMG3482_01871 [Achromobacter deleyi]